MHHVHNVFIWKENNEVKVWPNCLVVQVGDEIIWRCMKDDDFLVEFSQDRCPFRQHRFDRSGNRAREWTVVRNFPSEGYKYNVKAFGLDPLDPRILVDEP